MGKAIEGENQNSVPQFKVGDTDGLGNKILKILASKSKDYLIYKTIDGICIVINPYDLEDLKDQEDEYGKKLQEIEPNLSHARALSRQVQLRNSSKRLEVIDSLIANGIWHVFEGNYDLAKLMIIKAIDSLNRLIQINSRIQYLTGCFFVVVIALIALVLSGSLFPQTWSIYIEVMFCGALGGYLSVGISSNRLQFEPDSTRQMNILAGASRILIAISSSIFIYFAVKSDIFLGLITNSNTEGNINHETEIWAIRFFSVIAGFSESFVPDIIAKITNVERDGISSK